VALFLTVSSLYRNFYLFVTSSIAMVVKENQTTWVRVPSGDTSLIVALWFNIVHNVYTLSVLLPQLRYSIPIIPEPVTGKNKSFWIKDVSLNVRALCTKRLKCTHNGKVLSTVATRPSSCFIFESTLPFGWNLLVLAYTRNCWKNFTSYWCDVTPTLLEAQI
jgi:hypothetical protein